MTTIPTVRLNTGAEMPQLGFGVFQIPPDEVVEPVSTALEAGYRLIDTAAAYQNEDGVGKAIAASGVPRDELFVTTKLRNGGHGHDNALREFDESLRRLGLDTVDLYLIHWPLPMHGQYVETWGALERIYAEGRARAIGVSNFTATHLAALLAQSNVVPAVNQVELHPGFPQSELRDVHEAHDIVTEAWSPIGQGRGLLDSPVVREMAERYGRSPAQVVLRWHVQLGVVAIPKSVTPDRIRENLAVFDFELSQTDLGALTALDGVGRLGPDPDTFDAA